MTFVDLLVYIERNKWVLNNDINECTGCNKTFSLWYRKHHCRICGNIFCYYCLINNIDIPKQIKDEIPIESTGQMYSTKICNDCNNYISEINEYYNFSKKQIIQFDIFNIIDCIQDSKKHRINLHLLRKFANIKYKLNDYTCDDIEKKLIIDNMEYFSGHSCWIINIMKFIKFDTNDLNNKLKQIIENDRTIPCEKLFCNHFCHKEMKLIDILSVLKLSIKSNVIETVVLSCLKNCSKEELCLYLPIISYYIHKHPFILDFIMITYKDDIEVITELYWCIQLYNINKKFLLSFHFLINKSPFYKQIQVMQKFIDFNEDHRIYNFNVPLFPKEFYRSIDYENIKVIQSATKPCIIPLVGENENIKRNIIYKNEDIRIDQIIANIIKLSYIYLRENNILHYDSIITYKVLPLNKKCGLIEMVEGSTTIFDITENKGFTVQNYIVEHNSSTQYDLILNRFIESAAFYCIISYLLGLGDRHLDNIMISENGLLFHIDFSYILGNDPKYSSCEHIRLIPEIINVIGGHKSRKYKVFKKYCIDIYKFLRQHIYMFINILSLLPYINSGFSLKHIQKEIFKRFDLGDNEIEAELHIEKKLNLGGYFITDKILDLMYKSKKNYLS